MYKLIPPDSAIDPLGGKSVGCVDVSKQVSHVLW